MPTKVTQGQSKRDEIVEIASRLFYEQGFGATGIKQIIDEAGIAKGTFYSHFQSKDELGLAWLKARHTVWNGWFEDSVEQADAAAGILASFDFLEKWLEESSFRGCAFLNTMAEIPDPEKPMRKEVMAHKTGLRERFQKLTSAHFEKLGRSEEAAAQAATVIFLLFEGAIVEAQNFHQTWPIDSAREQVAKLLAP